jgi:NTE family protein
VPRPRLVDSPNPIALVLGGGGARGLAHIGVLKAIEERRVPVDFIVGTSVGACSAVYALRPDWRYVRDLAFDVLKTKGLAKLGKGLTDSATGRKRRAPNRVKMFVLKWLALTVLLARRGLASRKRLAGLVDGIIPDATFAQTKIPLAIVALDLNSGKEVVITEGSLRKAALASANLAGFFPPMDWGEHRLVDPSPVSSVPVDIARELGAAGVIAVDIRSRVMPSTDAGSGADTVFRIAAMASERSNDAQVAHADVVVAPDVGSTYWSDFSNLQAHVDEGERAALRVMGEIDALMLKLGRTPRA